LKTEILRQKTPQDDAEKLKCQKNLEEEKRRKKIFAKPINIEHYHIRIFLEPNMAIEP